MTSTQDGEAPAREPAREHGLPLPLLADPAFGPLRALLLLLTVVTGVVDAVSILALGRVFVANMTGNVVFAAFAVSGAPGFSLGASLFALAGFLAGAYLGGLQIGRTGQNAVARKLAVPDLTTTVLTMTLTGLGADLRAVTRGTGPAGEGKKSARAAHSRRLLAVATMVAGAVAGALLTLHVSPVSGLSLATGLLAVVASAAVAATRRPAPWRIPGPEA